MNRVLILRGQKHSIPAATSASSSLTVLDGLVDRVQSFDQSRVRVVHRRVQRVGDERPFIPLEEVDEAGLERLAVIMLYCEGVRLVLGPPDEVHGDEVEEEADGHVNLGEEEEVEEVRHIPEPERLDDPLVPQDEREAQEHDRQRYTGHDHLLDNVLVDDVPKLVVDHRTDLFNRVLGDESVKEDHFAEAPETGDECI